MRYSIELFGTTADVHVGIDVFAASSPRDFALSARLDLEGPPRAIGEYALVHNYRVNRERRPIAYARCAEYHHQTDPDAPAIDLQFFPTKRYRPTVRVTVRATIRRLLTLSEAQALEAEVIRALGVPTKLARVEVAFDFAACVEFLEELQRHLYFPRVRHAKSLPDLDCHYRGARRSDQSLRLYWKREDDEAVQRLEWILNRGKLRALNVNSVGDLGRTQLADHLPFRFVSYDERPLRNPVVGPMVGHVFDLLGPNGFLKHHRRNRWARKCLRPAERASESFKQLIRRFLAS